MVSKRQHCTREVANRMLQSWPFCCLSSLSLFCGPFYRLCGTGPKHQFTSQQVSPISLSPILQLRMASTFYIRTPTIVVSIHFVFFTVSNSICVLYSCTAPTHSVHTLVPLCFTSCACDIHACPKSPRAPTTGKKQSFMRCCKSWPHCRSQEPVRSGRGSKQLHRWGKCVSPPPVWIR